MKRRYAIHLPPESYDFIRESLGMMRRKDTRKAVQRISIELLSAAGDAAPDNDGTKDWRYAVFLTQEDWATLTASVERRRFRVRERLALRNVVLGEMLTADGESMREDEI